MAAPQQATLTAIQCLQNGWTIDRAVRRTGLSREYVAELADLVREEQQVIDAALGRETSLASWRCPACGRKVFGRYCRACATLGCARRQRRTFAEAAEAPRLDLLPDDHMRYLEVRQALMSGGA